jgi:hypothetical protein
MNKMILPRLPLTLILILGGLALSARAEENKGFLQVTITDDAGSLVQNAHIYIFSRNMQKFFGTYKASEAKTFELPTGDYRVYAALAIDINGVIDHYSSPEAFVHLNLEEPSSVILCLQKSAPSELVMSDVIREKLGIDDRIARTPAGRHRNIQ